MLALLLVLSQSDGADTTTPPEPPPTTPTGAVVFERGPDMIPLVVPREEELVYRAAVGVGPLGATVGTVTTRSRIEPYRDSLIVPGPTNGEPRGETAVFSIQADGSYAFYSMDALIESRILPQEWPWLAHRYVSKGSEKRRREINVGRRDGEWTVGYRKDTRDGAPRGTRIWNTWEHRVVPEGSLDMLGAVFLLRSFLQTGEEVVYFPLVDKLRIWQMKIRRGERRRVATGVGTFDAVRVLFEPRPWPGEKIDEEKRERFKGLFGLQGAIQIWADARTGIPIRILGELPIAWRFSLDLDIELAGYSGTPPEFAPVE